MQLRLLVVSVLVVAGLCGAAVCPAAAQGEPRTTVAGGYTYVREQGAAGLGVASYPIGWVVTGSQRLGAGRVSGAGEFGISQRDNVFSETQRLMGLFGGARFGLFRSTSKAMFAQVLIGMERFSEPGFIESGLAIQPGVGVDWMLGARYFLRTQADYRLSRQTGGTFNTLRAVAGVGARIGR